MVRNISPKTIRAVEKIVEYLYKDESINYEINDKPKNHIFLAVRQLDRAFVKQEIN